MPQAVVLELLRALRNAHIRTWLDGGWGVDALLFRQTRKHKDLDIVVEGRDAAETMLVLEGLGYGLQKGGLPRSFVLARGQWPRHQVDVHVVNFDGQRNGVCWMPSNFEWTYPAESFGWEGLVGDTQVRCISPRTQILRHECAWFYYKTDLHDLAELSRRYNVPLPDKFERLALWCMEWDLKSRINGMAEHVKAAIIYDVARDLFGEIINDAGDVRIDTTRAPSALAVKDMVKHLREQLAMRRPEMTQAALLPLLQLFRDAGIGFWLDGGWGVDALLGHQTRKHGDVDMIIADADFAAAQQLLSARGFAVQPWNTFVMEDGATLQVNFHVVTFDEAGNGLWYAEPGVQVRYPAYGFAGTGTIGGMPVRCLTPEAQIPAHRCPEGPREKDLLDLGRLAECFNLEIPPRLRRPGQ
jgi:lincosamide nucleotidyltransferase A/C/D/E